MKLGCLAKPGRFRQPRRPRKLLFYKESTTQGKTAGARPTEYRYYCRKCAGYFAVVKCGVCQSCHVKTIASLKEDLYYLW